VRALALWLATPLAAIALASPAVADDSGAPRVLSVDMNPPAVLGRSADLRVSAVARDSPVSGMVAVFGAGDSFGLSACRAARPARAWVPGAFRRGTPVQFTAPHVFRKAGAQGVLIRLDAGGCAGSATNTNQPLIVTPTAPGEAPVPPTVSRPSGPGGQTQQPPGIGELIGELIPPLPLPGPLPPVPGSLPLPGSLPVAQAARHARPCRGANQLIGRSARAAREARRAVVCLLNAQRRAHGLRPLRANIRLRRAAEGHTRSMVRRRYFSHTQPGGVSLVSRLRRTRYLRAASSWAVGENIGFGRGNEAGPRGMVRSWMQSSPHRATILERRFSEVGLGISRGVPGHPGSRGATYTADFGTRRR
jgi:uncharacterized protein YkwD